MLGVVHNTANGAVDVGEGGGGDENESETTNGIKKTRRDITVLQDRARDPTGLAIRQADTVM